MVLNREKNILYACTIDNSYAVCKYQRNDDTKTWELVEELAKTGIDDVEVMLQLKLDNKEKMLFGTTSNGFVIWDFDEENPVSTEAVVLQLPHGTRNITTKMLQSNSIMLSAHRNYAVAGVRYFRYRLVLICKIIQEISRKNLYVWGMETQKLVKILDAHFGRIMQLEALTIGNWNSVVTSSIDRSVKIWNINNIFEQVHVIDRHELPIDSIRYLNHLNVKFFRLC